MNLKHFKNKSIQKYYHKEILSQSNNTTSSASKIKSIGFIVDDTQKKDPIVKLLKKELEIHEGKIHFLVYKEYEKGAQTESYHFSEEDFGWNATIKTPALDNFVSKEYDLLINFSDIDNLFTNIVVLLSKATFKTGFASNDTSLYQLMIACDHSQLIIFVQELKKYLHILKKL